MMMAALLLAAAVQLLCADAPASAPLPLPAAVRLRLDHQLLLPPLSPPAYDDAVWYDDGGGCA
eukprot:COSAG01_NODE_41195_length_454_cov_1.597183_1_plen_62_part_10